MLRITAPATSANLGPGFDAIGMAVSLFSTFEVEVCDSGFAMIDALGRENFDLSGSLIFKAMQCVFKMANWEPAGLRMRYASDIPSGRGLGSSAACIAAGVTAANALLAQPLPMERIIEGAVSIEGHPDNVLPALLGGACIGVMADGQVPHVRFMPEGDLCAVAMIPSFELMTVKSRGVLPERVPRADAVFSAGRAALLTAALLKGEYNLLRCAAEDKLHQPYRKPLINGYDELFEAAYESGAYCAYLSGAGPTLMALCQRSVRARLISVLDACAKNFRGGGWRMLPLDICANGAFYENILDSV